MWTGLIGAAAAHKATATAVGLSVLLSGTVAETTGVGPAVRESVRHALVGESDNGELVLANASATPTPPPEATATPETPTATETPEAIELAATLAEDEAVASESAQSLPGNLVTHVNPRGRFSLRAEIASASGTALSLLTEDGELEIDVAGARIHTAGAPTGDVEWSDYVGFGVFVTGTCVLPANEASVDHAEALEASGAETVDVAVADCETLEAERVQVLGRAGQGGRPEEAGPPDDAGKPEPSATSADEDDAASIDDDDEAEDSGRPGGNGRGRRD